MPDSKKTKNLQGVDARQVAALIFSGSVLYRQGRFSDARNIFEGLALLDPRNAYVQAALGGIFQHQREYEAAISCYSKALDLYPQDVGSLTNRGEVYLLLGKLEHAAADLKRAIELGAATGNPAANRARLLAMATLETIEIADRKGVESLRNELSHLAKS